MLTKVFKSCLTHPLVRNLNIDSPEAILLHSQMIREKPFLRHVYKEWYISISKLLPNTVTGSVLELGSGGGFLKDFLPGLVSSETHQAPCIDIVLDGQCLPFKRASLRGIVMIDVFHHLPCVNSFLSEAIQCVKPGGAVIMIEPWATRWSRLIFKYLHHEPFHPEAKTWNFSKGGPLSQANSALPWIVFDRDQKRFEKEFPGWCIKDIELHSPFCYLLSGGVSLRSLMPGCLFWMWRKIEEIMNPWMNSWAMFATINLARKHDR